jgi:hypothetical protein
MNSIKVNYRDTSFARGCNTNVQYLKLYELNTNEDKNEALDFLSAFICQIHQRRGYVLQISYDKKRDQLKKDDFTLILSLIKYCSTHTKFHLFLNESIPSLWTMKGSWFEVD